MTSHAPNHFKGITRASYCKRASNTTKRTPQTDCMTTPSDAVTGAGAKSLDPVVAEEVVVAEGGGAGTTYVPVDCA